MGAPREELNSKKKRRIKKISKAKKLKREDNEKELESVVSRYKDLTKVSSSSFNHFTDFPLSSRTLRGLEDCNYEEPTDIQKESLPFSLSGSDVVGAAKTGSGKTLALIIPVLECLWRSSWSTYGGLGALIISPTRELALQTFTVINNVGKHHDFSCALLIGGTDVEYERSRLGSINIIICTPGRLLQHMDENEHLSCDQLQILVLDEADRILDMGFSQQVNAIIANLPAERQTLLFSATQTRSVKDLSRVCTKDPVFVSAHERCAHATPDCLVQWYMVCEEQDKARFLTHAFCHLRPGLPVMGLWGTMNQKKRVDAFQKFENKEAAVMIATDVASRGLDFSDVDWVVQVDCPASVEDYIHRVGRTARMNQTGHAVLFLTPSQEEGMIAALKQASIPLEKQVYVFDMLHELQNENVGCVRVHHCSVDPNALVDVRTKMQAVLSQFPELNQHAQKSVVAYLRSIYMMRNKRVFDVTTVNAAELAASFGLVTVPRVRFLSRKGMNITNPENKKDGEKAPRPLPLSQHIDSSSNDQETFGPKCAEVDENDDLFVVKKRDVFSLLKDNHLPECNVVPSVAKASGGTKIITKMNAAKKLLNKKVKLSVRKVFDEEGEVAQVDGIVDSIEESAGLDLASAVESMKRSNVEDRKRHKELIKQRRKEERIRLKKKRNREKEGDLDLGEGGSGIDSDADLSFLPDPDEVFKKYAEEGKDDAKQIIDEESSHSAPLRKRRKQTKELKTAEQQALALLTPF
ncbi:DEAD/DEAH box helicase [Necator americanus]|uniref:ATP-dependent RNA helicase n=1 Tax=Necator americanus TaxID=51031 RepID=W2SZC3_NECAM|nr:DEAD/DEAH box helicase [Necator americanus]ETN75085.1 DEAD/DEAH box helicase [Necator americanus]